MSYPFESMEIEECCIPTLPLAIDTILEEVEAYGRKHPDLEENKRLAGALMSAAIYILDIGAERAGVSITTGARGALSQALTILENEG